MGKDRPDWVDAEVVICVDEEEDLTGRMGVCSIGRIGIIEGRKALNWGVSWIGTGVLDGESWASRQPWLLSEHEQELLAKTVLRGEHGQG